MLSDLDLIVHELKGDVTIYPIADVHLGAVEHSEGAWQEFVKKVENSDAKLILAGDLLNNSLRSTKFANPFDEAIRPRDAKKRMAEYLEPIKDRILCVVTGNHERRTSRDDDQDLTYDICSKLDIEHLYRENIAFMKIALGRRNNKDASRVNRYTASYIFAVTHGAGGGIYTGVAVNRGERFGNIMEGIDCLVFGHSHKGFVTKPAKITVNSNNNTVRMSHYTVVSCVSWLNYGGYAAHNMLLPSQVCDPQAIHLSGKRDKKLTTSW